MPTPMTAAYALVVTGVGASIVVGVLVSHGSVQQWFNLGLVLVAVGILWLMALWTWRRVECVLDAYRTGYQHGRVDATALPRDVDEALRDDAA